MSDQSTTIPDPLFGKRVLIFGGLGLIGSTTARQCIARGAIVTIADNRTPDYGANDFNLADLEGKFTLATGDIRDKAFVDRLVPGRDYIFNYAGQVNHNVSIENPILDIELNLIGHINVLMAARKHNPDAKLIYPGSRLQYGRISQLPVHETHPRKPLSIYAIHKNAAEQYYKAFHTHYGIRSVCFRITNPYGPRAQMRNPGNNLVNWFIRQALDGQTLTVYGTGEQQRDYIYIDDLIDGILRAAVEPRTDGEVYNIGSGTPIRFIDMAQAVVDAVGKGKVESVPWPKNYDNFETGDFYADISRIVSHIGWKPSVEFSAGIAMTVEYYRKNRLRYW